MGVTVLRFKDEHTAHRAYLGLGFAPALARFPPRRNPDQPDAQAPDAWLPSKLTGVYAIWPGEPPEVLRPFVLRGVVWPTALMEIIDASR